MSVPPKEMKEQTLSEAPQEPILGSRAGWLTDIDSAGRPWVDFEGNPEGVVAAQLAASVDAHALAAAASRRQKVVLLFENGDPRRPFLMALLQEPSPTPLLDGLLEAQVPPVAQRPVEAWVDGQRVTIQGKEEIILQCGEASITLRRNGKVIIKGTTLEASATGAHRIKGATVEVN